MSYDEQIANLRAECARLERVRAELKAERERIQALVMMLTSLDRKAS